MVEPMTTNQLASAILNQPEYVEMCTMCPQPVPENYIHNSEGDKYCSGECWSEDNLSGDY